MALETKKEGNVVSSLAATQPLPKMVKIKQLLDHSHYTVEEIPGIVHKELDRPELRERIRPGDAYWPSPAAPRCGKYCDHYKGNR